MLNEINVLREQLEEQVITNAPYQEILMTSKKIDNLLVDYYKSLDNYKLFV